VASLTPVPRSEIHVLLVEDEPAHVELVRRGFDGREGWRLSVATSVTEARALLGERRPDVVIADLCLPDGRGFELLSREVRPEFPLVVMTSHGDETMAVEAMKAGALDYVVKDGSVLADVPRIAERALREWRLVVELRQTERELRHAQKMEAIGRLASGIAHDFNNVLMGIIGCADVAMSKLASPVEARRAIAEIKKAALSGASVASGLLQLTRREGGETHAVALDGAVREMHTMLQRLLGEDVELRMRLAAPDACIRIGEGQIEQVLINLAVNARDAMPRGGKLVVRSEPVRMNRDGAGCRAGLEPGCYALVSVSDTGVGMDEQTRSRAVEPFFTTKGVGKGTGLGLSTVYGIVRQAHGHLELQSAPGAGTTVRIWLPLVGETPAGTAVAAAAAAPADVLLPLTVLLVEDEPLVRLGLRHWLEQQGHAVVEADGPEAAGSAAARLGNAIQLVLTDVVMPGGDGLAVVAAVHAHVAAVPVVWMSAYPRSWLLEQRRIPQDAVALRKPFAEGELLEAIRTALASAREQRRPEQRQRVRVLFVEDDELSRTAGCELLADAGFDTVGAESARAALERWEAARGGFDVVLTDVRLPDFSGIELVERLRQRCPELRAIFVTGRAPDGTELARALAAPHTAYLAKPTDAEAMARRIREVLGQHARPPGTSADAPRGARAST
jgi:DNA-binding NtrC family response regulator